MSFRTLTALAALTAALLFAMAVPVDGQDPAADGPAGTIVGTIEMVVDGRKLSFDVVEGPVSEGFATGYNAQPRGEAMMLGASLQGRQQGAPASVQISVGVWQESLEHMCDPFANQLRYSPEGAGASILRLRPGARGSESCPGDGGGSGSLALHIDLDEATLDEESGALTVRGTFSGPLGRGDEASVVTDGRYEATVRSFRALRGG